MTMTRTYSPRASEIERQWFLVDADGETLGRLASRVSRLLSGKHKPGYATHIDTGDHVVVVNASKVAVSRNKLTDKVYARHSGYPGGFREETLGDLLARRPEEVIRRAVKGMLPRNTLGVQQLRKLKIYAGAEHPHEAQRPSELANAANETASAARAAGGEAAPAEQNLPEGATAE
jgi:large subunit ribosomal protein L13